MEKIEETLEAKLDFSKLQQIGNSGCAVVPCVVQDTKTNEVLIIAYVNKEALEYTLKHKIAAFWSTSRNELWVKGKTSGDFLNVKEVRVNCELNSLIYKVSLVTESSCHTGRYGCYYRRMNDMETLEFINEDAN